VLARFAYWRILRRGGGEDGDWFVSILHPLYGFTAVREFVRAMRTPYIASDADGTTFSDLPGDVFRYV